MPPPASALLKAGHLFVCPSSMILDSSMLTCHTCPTIHQPASCWFQLTKKSFLDYKSASKRYLRLTMWMYVSAYSYFQHRANQQLLNLNVGPLILFHDCIKQILVAKLYISYSSYKKLQEAWCINILFPFVMRQHYTVVFFLCRGWRSKTVWRQSSKRLQNHHTPSVFSSSPPLSISFLPPNN